MIAWEPIESGTSAALSGVWADARTGRLWTIAREPDAIRMRDASGAWVEWGLDAWHEPVAIAGSRGAVCVATTSEMMRAADGVTWRRMPLHAKAIVAHASGRLFARTDAAIVCSDDAGATWRALRGDREIAEANHPALVAREANVVGASAGARVFVAGSEDGRVCVKVGDGSSWTTHDLGVIGEPTALVAESAEDALVVGRAGLARATHDGGETWTRERIVTGADLLGACVDDGGGVYVVGDAGVIFARRA